MLAKSTSTHYRALACSFHIIILSAKNLVQFLFFKAITTPIF